MAVLLSVPFGLAGSFLFIQMMGGFNSIIPIFGAASNNIYTQIALIMLIGLLAKNAILITEFALDRRKMGMSITWAAVLGAGARNDLFSNDRWSVADDVLIWCRSKWQ